MRVCRLLTLGFMPIFVLLAACSKTTTPAPMGAAPTAPSLMTVAALTAQKGEPTVIRSPAPDPSLKVWVYADSSWQVENGLVTASFRDPKEQEIYLQYWLQRWKGHKIEKHELPVAGHPDQSVEYSDLVTHESVIYNAQTNQVDRVVLHAE